MKIKIYIQGKYIWSETKSYVGYFNNLCLHGFGIFYKDNEIYKGKYFFISIL